MVEKQNWLSSQGVKTARNMGRVSPDAAREKDLARQKDFGFFLAQTTEVREAGLLPCADFGGERGGSQVEAEIRRTQTASGRDVDCRSRRARRTNVNVVIVA